MELSLDLSLVYVPKTISEYLREVSMVKDSSLKLSKLDDYLNRLEDEMRKIDAFKRELPLCMLLLSDAIMQLKEEAMQCNKELEDRVAVDEVLTVNGNSSDGKVGNGISEKKNWMSSVQLWNTNEINSNAKKQDSKSETKQRSEEEDDLSTCENPIQLGNCRSKGGAFVPFNKSVEREEKEVVSQVTGLSLMTPRLTELVPLTLNNNNNNAMNQIMIQTMPQQQHPPYRYRTPQESPNKKQRRCWSPALHRSFVEALQQLGGSQAATPKQIRELMQVDGLTNDEVKSHLQKYRLHMRKHSTVPGRANGIWTGQEQCKDPTKATISQSNSPQGPFHGCGLSKGTPSTGGDSNGMENDEKSESHSWDSRLHRAGEVQV